MHAARGEQEKGLYLRFLNNLVNDSIYLLDESIKMLPTIKEKEAAAQASAGDSAQFVTRRHLMCVPYPGTAPHSGMQACSVCYVVSCTT